MIDTVSTTYINKYVLLSLCLQGFPDTINYTVEKAQETVNCDKAFWSQVKESASKDAKTTTGRLVREISDSLIFQLSV